MLSDTFFLTAIPYYEEKELKGIKLYSTVSCSKFSVISEIFGLFFPTQNLILFFVNRNLFKSTILSNKFGMGFAVIAVGYIGGQRYPVLAHLQ